MLMCVCCVVGSRQTNVVSYIVPFLVTAISLNVIIYVIIDVHTDAFIRFHESSQV